MRRTLTTVGLIYFAAAMFFALDEAGYLTLPPTIHRLFAEIGVALLAVGSIHILDHFSIINEVAGKIVRQSREMLETAIQGSTATMKNEVTGSISQASNTIIDDVTKQTKIAFSDASQILQRQVESIKVMEQCSLIGIYPSRSAAAQAIRSAIASSGEVWLMGISLNEFCRERQGPFLEAWEELVKGIRAGTKRARLLLIDPYCHGAVLRSYSETVNSVCVSDRLEADVKAATKLLRQIRLDLGSKSSDLEVRLYGLAPTMFICRVDSGTFVQNYHFWKSKLPGCPIPVLQYRKRPQGIEGVCIHTELEQHFQFVWRHASIRLDEQSESSTGEPPSDHFLPRPTRGMEWGAHVSGMGTVFIDRSRPAARMQEEIHQSQRIWIQGITLRAFFDDSPIAKSLARRMADQSNADIRVMLLDADCEQAKFRAYREFLLNSEQKLGFSNLVWITIPIRNCDPIY